MLSYFVLGAGIGMVAGLSPGPVLMLVVSETLRGGWARGTAVALGPLLADGPIIVVAVLVLAQLPPWLVPALSLLGGVFLIYLGLTSILASRRLQPATTTKAGAGLLKGFLARALSPNPYLFWLLVGGPLLVQGTADQSAAFLLGYYVTIVGSNVALALALGRYVGRLSERVSRGLLLGSGVLLAAFGLLLVQRGIKANQ